MDRLFKQARSSGSLNLSNRSLREVPNEVYKNLEAAGEDEKWWEGVALQKLILAHNEIEVLREDVRNLTMLSILNISHNNLARLPAAIGELSLLKSLDVSFNSLTSIPEDIGSLTSLIKLDCSNNLLNGLPHSLGGCIDLVELKEKHPGARNPAPVCENLAPRDSFPAFQK
ncbi:plant intracellular Ras-group-related LRR protein 6-like [Phalaenopsis equestris]|uniref:plant intracellular Ras-group-related LRR protein 6-like n=1 Tax=Phalaenopsis equestris TaxID=78828 RepID=UPI0009E33333|nr:plant intracellular Ras-group-related LRR protein 6-like [Phalaenopsis equestris]